MNNLIESIKDNPVRLAAIVSAVVALGAYFVPSDAWPLAATLVLAVFGAGEVARSKVTPTHHVVVDEREVPDAWVDDADEIDELAEAFDRLFEDGV